jgi:tetratricopeptide (TPR) repeat protein
MKLIQGRTLAELLRERQAVGHIANVPESRPAGWIPTPQPDLPRFLAIFAQVCQTLSYAHSQGVLHRDVKPGNVMVGAFGEVQVMDWGLAKVLARPDIATSGSLVTAEPTWRPQVATKETTQTGTVVGTFAYMPPEQACGDAVDERADVFSLGALLCEILTDRPPYTGRDKDALWQMARKADLEEALARLDGCGVDAELIALARRCLAPDQHERPRDAAEVAQAVADYLTRVEERARQAEQARAAAQARAEEARATATAERRARRLTLGLAAATLLLVVACGLVAWVFQQQHAAGLARQQEADRKTSDRLAEGRALLQTGWKTNDLGKLAAAQAQSDQAAEIASGAGDAVRVEAAQLQEDVKRRMAAAKRNRALLTAWLDVHGPQETGTYEKGDAGLMLAVALPKPDEQFAAAFGRWGSGVDIDRDALADVVARIQAEPEPVVQELVAGLDEWARQRRLRKRPEAQWRRLLDVAERLDKSDRRREVRRLLAGSPLTRTKANAALFDKTRAELRRLAGKVDPRTEPVLGLVSLAHVLQALGDAQAAEALLRPSVAVRRDDAMLLYALGKLLEGHKPPRLAEAIECYRAASAARPSLGMALGMALVQSQRADEVLVVLRDLAGREPENPEKHFYLGVALIKQKNMDEAITHYRQVIALVPTSSSAYVNLGVAQAKKGQMEEALRYFRKAVEIDDRLAQAQYNLSNALGRTGRTDEALTHLRRAVQLNPSSARGHADLGTSLLLKGQWDEAIKHCRQANALDPRHAPAHAGLGSALLEKGQVDEAIEHLRRAIALDPELTPAHAVLGEALEKKGQVDEAITHLRRVIDLAPRNVPGRVTLAISLHKKGELDEAIKHCREAIALDPKFCLAHRVLGGTLFQKGQVDEAIEHLRQAQDLGLKDAPTHALLGAALWKKGEVDEAIEHFRQAIALDPKLGPPHTSLGLALEKKGQLDEAIRHYRQGLELGPADALAHGGLGSALERIGQLDEAIRHLRRAIALDPKDVRAHNSLGGALWKKADVDEAIRHYRQAVELDPRDPLAQSNLGAALGKKGRTDEAITHLRRAVELDAKLALAHLNLGGALRQKGRLDEAVKHYHQAIDLDPKNVLAHANLGNVLSDKGQVDEAITHYRQAIALGSKDPQIQGRLGAALWRKGQLEEAITHFRRAVALDTKYAWAH